MGELPQEYLYMKFVNRIKELMAEAEEVHDETAAASYKECLEIFEKIYC